ncbi:hypothetical protein AVEN_30055-1 [Araneus ventricosus]|uniref:Tc3 transposase DNA binding domain-containing protein n=1 Tax=Araneus ventricosus TaxID=182803 RepID=A0A4Y2I6N4_ARAVE|nr:hypothetical protein AVEN_30055-1 [Araneus ventricosus]
MNSESVPNLHREHYELERTVLSESILEDENSSLISGYDDKSSLTSDRTFMKTQNLSLVSSKATYCIILWYFFSFTTLFLNKYILAYEQGDPALLGSAQLLMCGICGYAHIKFPCGLYKSVVWERTPPRFFRNMLLVGSLRSVPAAAMACFQDLSDFERGVIVGAREMGYSISGVAMKFGFSRTTISRVYSEYRVSADFNDGASTSVSVRTVQRTVINMDSQSRRPIHVPLLTALHKALLLSWAQQLYHWVVDDWKQVNWSDESRFQLYRTDACVRR